MTLLTIMRFIAIMIAALFFAGCQKKSDTSSPVTQPPSAAAPAANSQGTTAPDAAGSSSSLTNSVQVEPNLDEIHRAVLRWILRNRRPPKNFEDFAATTDYKIPPPPPGKKYALDKHMHVILLNQ